MTTNDKGWQRRSDQWVQATHESRVQKEKRIAEIRKQKQQAAAESQQEQEKGKD